MTNRIEYKYDTRIETINDAVFEAWLNYCKCYQEYPRLLYISVSEAGYTCYLLQTEIDHTLQSGMLVLER